MITLSPSLIYVNMVLCLKAKKITLHFGILHKDIHITFYSSYCTKCFTFIITIIIIINTNFLLHYEFVEEWNFNIIFYFLAINIASGTEQV